MNEGVQELGFLCLWNTGVSPETLPNTWTPERVGLQGDPKVLRLPDGIEEVGDMWFCESEIEKLIVPSSTKKFGAGAFASCKQLREVVLLFDYDQGDICNFRYRPDELGEDARNGIQRIQTNAFDGCRSLSLFSFRDGSRLERADASRYPQLMRWRWRLSKGASEEQDAEERQ